MGFKLKKNDFVVVIKGKDRGKKGRILKTVPEENRILVEGINFVRKHTKQRTVTKQGGIVTMEKPVSAGNVQYFCMKCSKPVRLGIKLLEGGTRMRFCKKCGEVLESK